MPITTYTKEKVIRKNGVDAILTTGTKIAEITVSGDTQEIFAPDVTPIELTAADYAGLTSAEKMDPQVVYFVKDIPDCFARLVAKPIAIVKHKPLSPLHLLT